MAPFLANELWNAILSLLPRDDLPSISRTSKQLHQVVEPMLYHTFDATKHNDGPGKAVVYFLRTLLNNPGLASNVKNVTLRVMARSNGVRTEFGTLDMFFFTDNNRAWMQEQIVSRSMLPHSICEDWYSSISADGNWDAVISFLLLLVSQDLECLTMHNYGALSHYYFINRLLGLWSDTSRKSTHEGRNPFSQLSEIHVHKNEANGGAAQYMTLINVLPYVKLKSVRKFTGRGFADASFQMIANRVFNTESVILEDCRITNSVLKNFLGSFAALKKFQWTDNIAVSIGNVFNAIGNVPQLEAHLEELIIDDASNGGRYTLPTIQDLTQFSILKTITIDSFSALGAMEKRDWQMNTDMDEFPHEEPEFDPPDVLYPAARVDAFIAALPASLEYLMITACRKPIFDCVLRIVTHNKGKSLPNLTQLALAFDDDRWAYAHRSARLDEYTNIASKNGVKLILPRSH
ncbi:hypothetical protein EG329_006978 [Mollisiaceae sp. DMI_Dod_QoI]|nr:hypothetical protein EG329_006978 [Helotiales sp. DMI_Dod_QoI]